jgi:hypothetical protein
MDNDKPMKPLYESILGKDYDVDDEAIILRTLQQYIDQPYTCSISKSGSILRLHPEHRNDTITVDADKFFDTIKLLKVKTIYFDKVISPYTESIVFKFAKNTKLVGYTIYVNGLLVFTSESLKIKLTLQNCNIRSTGSTSYEELTMTFGSCDAVLKNTDIEFEGLFLSYSDLTTDSSSEIKTKNVHIQSPTKSQYEWLWGHGFDTSDRAARSLSANRIKAGNPLELIETKQRSDIECITVHLTLVKPFKFFYKKRLYSQDPDTYNAVDMANGWIANRSHSE